MHISEVKNLMKGNTGKAAILTYLIAFAVTIAFTGTLWGIERTFHHDINIPGSTLVAGLGMFFVASVVTTIIAGDRILFPDSKEPIFSPKIFITIAVAKLLFFITLLPSLFLLAPFFWVFSIAFLYHHQQPRALSSAFYSVLHSFKILGPEFLFISIIQAFAAAAFGTVAFMWVPFMLIFPPSAIVGIPMMVLAIIFLDMGVTFFLSQVVTTHMQRYRVKEMLYDIRPNHAPISQNSR